MKIIGKEVLKQLQQAELSGEMAHKIYAPPHRPMPTEEEILAMNPKLAAVNILLYLKDNEWHFPLMLRTENKNDQHSGQISLPGGKQEPTDKDFAETALRETYEEIGIAPEQIKIIRELSPIYIAPSHFYVRPFLSFTGKHPQFHLQETEAVELIEFPLAGLLHLPIPPISKILPTSKGREVPIISIGEHHIWGATSMILSELSDLLKNL